MKSGPTRSSCGRIGNHPTRCEDQVQARWRAIAFALSLVWLFVGGTGYAQVGSTASVSGSVTDETGAAVSGASVTVHNVDTGIDRTTQTGGSGSYAVSQLQPGHYSLSVSGSGFKLFQQQNITLTIGQIAQLDARLQIGTQQEQITVDAGAPAIQTQDASVGLVIDSATITDTPLNGRLGITGLLALAPGVQAAGSQDQIPVFGVTPAINSGARNAYGAVGFTLDGGVNMNIGLQRPLGEVPPLDGIAEFKVITTNAPAEYNQAAQIVVVSRGGTNQFHGTLLEFNRVAATAAKFYFAGAQPKPKYIRTSSAATSRDRLLFLICTTGVTAHSSSSTTKVFA